MGLQGQLSESAGERNAAAGKAEKSTTRKVVFINSSYFLRVRPEHRINIITWIRVRFGNNCTLLSVGVNVLLLIWHVINIIYRSEIGLCKAIVPRIMQYEVLAQVIQQW